MPGLFDPKLEEVIAGVQQMPTGLTIIDRDLRMLFWNQAVLELLDLPETLVKPGATLVDIFRYNALRGDYGPGDPEEQVTQRVARALRFEPHRFERKRKDGRIIDITGRVLYDDEHTPWGFVTIYQDVTRERTFENELQEKNARLSAALREVEQARLELVRAGAGPGNADAIAQVANKLARIAASIETGP